MASIKAGICPTCGKERELAYIKLGVIQATMCVFCLERYLKVCVIPRFQHNNSSDDDSCQISSKGVVIGDFIDGDAE